MGRWGKEGKGERRGDEGEGGIYIHILENGNAIRIRLILFCIYLFFLFYM